MLGPFLPKNPVQWSQEGGDKKTHQVRWFTPLLLKAGETNSSEVRVSGLRLKNLPSIVYFLIPGNPGVTTAYQPWLNHLSDQLGPNTLMCISSHLGHLTTSDEKFTFTCEENILHQETILLSIITDLGNSARAQGLPMPKIICCGHSAGAYFIVHALEKLLQRSELMTTFPEVKNLLHMIIYCGTLIQFGYSGRLKALVAASDNGVKLIRKLRKSNYATNRVNQNKFLQMLNDEFSDEFLANMSALTRDELIKLPTDIHTQLNLIKNFDIKVSFFFASNDPYVSKKVQKEYVKVFGRERVYIGEPWWHAFTLHSEGFDGAAALTEAVIRSPEGLIPKNLQNGSVHADCTAVMFDVRSVLAAVIVSIWMGCRSFCDLISHPISIFTASAPEK